MKRYITNCVSSTCEAITDMIDDAEDITREEFEWEVDEQELKEMAEKGLNERLKTLAEVTGKEITPELRKTYDDRLVKELGVINEMGFPGYFLVVMDFIRWGKQQGIPVGPGRGSGAGSLVGRVTC